MAQRFCSTRSSYRFPWLECVFADTGYNAAADTRPQSPIPVLRLEIVTPSDDLKGFDVQPRRWVVERTFSWFGRNRRLAKDFENLAATLLAFVTLACHPVRHQATRAACRLLSQALRGGDVTGTGAMSAIGRRADKICSCRAFCT